MLGKFSDLALRIHRTSRSAGQAGWMPAMFELLQPALNFDSAWWACGHLTAHGMVVHDQCLYRQPASLIQEYLALDLWRDDLLIQQKLAMLGRTVAMAETDFPSAQVREHCQRYGLAQSAGTMTVDPLTRVLTGFSFYRTDAGRPFSADDCALIQALVPHLLDAFEVVRRRDLGLSSDSTSTQALALLNADLMLLSLDAAAGAAFEAIAPGWQGPLLPPALARWLRRAPNPQPCLIEPWVFTASPTAGGLIALGIRPAGEFDHLPPRARQVARLYAEGLSQKEVAAQLSLSTSTVSNHLETVYRALAVRDKAALVHAVAGQRSDLAAPAERCNIRLDSP